MGMRPELIGSLETLFPQVSAPFRCRGAVGGDESACTPENVAGLRLPAQT